MARSQWKWHHRKLNSRCQVQSWVWSPRLWSTLHGSRNSGPKSATLCMTGDRYKQDLTRQELSMIHSANPQSRQQYVIASFRSFVTDWRTERRLCVRTVNLSKINDYYQLGLWSASWIKNKLTCVLFTSNCSCPEMLLIYLWYLYLIH